MASFVTNVGSYSLQGQGTPVVFASDTIKARLVASSATVGKDDTSMTPYTAIGTDQTLSSKGVANNTTDDRTQYTQSATLTWSAVAGGSTIGYIAVFKFVTNDAGSMPLFVFDITDTPTNGSDITWTPPSNILAFTQQ